MSSVKASPANYQRAIHASAQLHRKHRAFILQVPQALYNISSTFGGGSFTGQQPFGIHASAFVILFVLPCRLNLMVNCCVLKASLSGGQEGGDSCLRVILALIFWPW